MSVLQKREDRISIPDKLFYRIGEVSRIAGVESYVLRYWETEFPFLRPRKSNSGHRIYTKKDIEVILNIKKLLYEEKYTIEGVRKRFGIFKKESDAVCIDNKKEEGSRTRLSNLQVRQKAQKIRERLRRLLKFLKQD